MSEKKIKYKIKLNSIIFFLVFCNCLLAQNQITNPNSSSVFWQKVQFGGGLGLSVATGFTNVTIAPSAIYNFNKFVSAGVGLQGSYSASKNYFTSFHYGGSLITLFNPLDEVQLSVELEQLRVNTNYELINGTHYRDDFWNTGLFLGGGYRSNHVTVGARYNVLHNTNKNVYNEAFMPFVRVYF